MFQTYCSESLQFNTIHESIVEIIRTVVQQRIDGNEIPEWNDIVPENAHDYLLRRLKIRTLIDNLSGLLAGFSEADLNQVLNFIEAENQIEDLVSNAIPIPSLSEQFESIKLKLGEIFEEGFELLGKTDLRDQHYKAIYKSLRSKTCPFCGYMPLDSDGLKREDLDHYLDRATYKTAAANFHNLVPTCSKCNSRYKGTANVIFENGVRRVAFNPYGENHGDICLRESDPMGGEDFSPIWEISLVPDCEQSRTWDSVFSVRERLRLSCLGACYDSTLNELRDFFVVQNLYSTCSNEELVGCLQRFYTYKNSHPEQGLGFLKDKIADVFIYRIEEGDNGVISMIRDALQNPPQNQAA